MDNLIGIDIGGTSIKGGLVEGDKITKFKTLDTKADEGGDITLNILKGIIKSLRTPETIAIGIGVPSVVDSLRGIVYNVQNIKNWEEVHLKEILEEEFKLPVYLNNDANCFAMGERIYGVGQNYDNFVGITLGTGVGGGIIQKGELLSDNNCGSGEYGEMPYLDGKLEEYCGSFFFTKINSTGLDTMNRVIEQDPESITVLDEYTKHLAVLIKMVVLSVDPQAIIFGGSISNSFHLFVQGIYKHLQDFAFPNSIKRLKLLKSELQNIGILGASSLCFNK